MNRPRFLLLVGLAAAAAISRVLPHPWGFAPMTALALFGAATFASRAAAVGVTFGSMLLSDALLHATYLAGLQPNWGFYEGQWVVYGAMLAVFGLGLLLRRGRTTPRLVGVTFAGSLLFFLATNFAVWAGGSLYPQTPAGLLLCYEAALPFWAGPLRGESVWGLGLLGDFFYIGALFGALAVAERRFPMLRSAGRPAVSLA